MAAKLVLKSDLSAELKAHAPMAPIVRTDLSKELLKVIRWFDHHDEVYTTTDLNKQQLTWHQGIGKWLGYTDLPKGPLPANFMARYTHPFIQDWYQAYIDAAMLVFIRHNVRPLKYRFVISVPFKKAGSGGYMLVRHMGMPFELTKEGKIGNFIHSYFIVAEYTGEPLKLELFHVEKKLEEAMHREVEKEVLKCMDIRHNKNLTEYQFEILEILRQMREKEEDLTPANIARHVKGPRQTQIAPEAARRYLNFIKTHLLLLLETGNEPKGGIASDPFFLRQANARTVIQYFEQSGIISLLQAFAERKPPLSA